jgi:hypothetical protein
MLRCGLAGDRDSATGGLTSCLLPAIGLRCASIRSTIQKCRRASADGLVQSKELMDGGEKAFSQKKLKFLKINDRSNYILAKKK